MLPPPSARRWPDILPEKEVIRLWKHSGLGAATIVVYRRILGIFFAYCTAERLPPITQLTVEGAERFYRWYFPRGRLRCAHRELRSATRSPLFSYAWALSTAGLTIPPWKPPVDKPALPPTVAGYIDYAKEHRGLAESGLIHDASILNGFIDYLRKHGVSWKRVAVQDIDGFLQDVSQRWAPKTVGRAAYAIRSWLRFLHATGQRPDDLATAVVAPVRLRYDRPPRALPWPQVRALLRAVDATTAIGRRDRAQFLLMSAYGLGAAEVLQLRFEDIDWTGERLHITRRKTKVPIDLPLLPGVARALGEYVRRGRPKPVRSPFVFLSMKKPFAPFGQTGVLRHRVREAAKRAGIEAPILGTHLFRHSHATRQLEIGTAMKTLGDILGHRDPETTSIYTRAAVRHLRLLALPIPR
jgi:site-specific recombinase XerD